MHSPGVAQVQLVACGSSLGTQPAPWASINMPEVKKGPSSGVHHDLGAINLEGPVPLAWWEPVPGSSLVTRWSQTKAEARRRAHVLADTHTFPQHRPSGSASQAHTIDFCLIYSGTVSARPLKILCLDSTAGATGDATGAPSGERQHAVWQPLGKSPGAGFPTSPSAGPSPPSLDVGVLI